MEKKVCKTYFAVIYIAGEEHRIKDICAKYCQVGLCVSIQKTDYIYTGGQQSGFSITLINYPRFACSNDEIYTKAEELAKILIVDAYQESCTILCNDKTVFLSNRVEK